MTTPLTASLDQIATDWAALTPPDRTTRTYRELAARQPLTGPSADRGFRFGGVAREDPIGEDAGGASTQVAWLISADLYLRDEGRGRAALTDAIANESNLLARAVEQRTQWPTGVLEVITQGAEAELDPDSGDATITLRIRILTSETD